MNYLCTVQCQWAKYISSKRVNQSDNRSDFQEAEQKTLPEKFPKCLLHRYTVNSHRTMLEEGHHHSRAECGNKTNHLRVQKALKRKFVRRGSIELHQQQFQTQEKSGRYHHIQEQTPASTQTFRIRKYLV